MRCYVDGAGGGRGREEQMGDETVSECTKAQEGTGMLLEVESSTSIVPMRIPCRSETSL